ncbi:MAG: glycosyltransferase, partial [Bacteroidota bacterium]|nr:glycosyltransferase [Bacteroidota bacterium]
LELLLQAMNDERIKQANIILLIAGEFYEDEKPYLQIIKENRLENSVILKNTFIPDTEVKYYLCAADVVIQPYRHATQSGVTPLAYHFEKPMVVTDVGGLASLVPHGKVGLVCEPTPKSIADAILQFYQLGEDYFIPHLRSEKQKYSWSNLTRAINDLAEKVER